MSTLVDIQIVESNTLLAELVHHTISSHLTKVEGLTGDVVVDDVGGTKVEAEELKRIENPVVQDLVLEENILFGNVTIVVATSRHPLQRALSEHVGEIQQNANSPGEAIPEGRNVGREEEGQEAKVAREDNRQVQGRNAHHADAGHGAHALRILTDLVHNQVGTQGVDGNQETDQTKRLTETNETLLNIVHLTRSLVMLEVHRLAPPRVGVDLGNPDQSEHEVLDPLLFLKIQLMNEIVLPRTLR